MGKRNKVGLIFSYNENWIGGSYYILNLIESLKLLDDNLMPSLVVFSSSNDDFDRVKQLDYPYIEFFLLEKDKISISFPFFFKVINKLFKIMAYKKLLYKKPSFNINDLGLDVLFPAVDDYFFKPVKNKVFWIPDFQEHFLPQFFKKSEVEHRKSQQNKLIENNRHVVFSSYTAQQHFFEIYPEATNKTSVLQFAVTHPNYQLKNSESVLKKYNINNPYFFCSNQFWAHKNHKVIFDALIKIKSQGEKIQVVFSGKETDYRNPNFIEEIKMFVKVNNLEEFVKFLGFIDRADQLLLMKKAIAVIQPSLFEGWSTVVEDVKAMSQYLILSSIDVHKEQVSENVLFFNPNKPTELANILLEINKTNPIKTQILYDSKRFGFANNFINVINS